MLAGGAVLSACGVPESAGTVEPPAPTPAQPPTSPPLATAVPASPTPTEAPVEAAPTEAPVEAAPTEAPPAPAADTYLAVARGGEPEALVRSAIAALGGIERFVHGGDDVIIKPNICVAYHTHEYAATTNPWVVGALVKMALEAGARRVRVMDFPFGGGPEEAYVRSGIQEQVLAAGGEMEIMSHFKFIATEIPEGIDLLRADIYDDILKADVVINVPIAKHHGLARLTLGMKNLMGVVRDRPSLHLNLSQRIADLTSRVRPTLTVVDAVRMLMANGPSGGNLDDVKQADTVIASADIVAADSYAVTLFEMQPHDIGYIKAAAEMGLGRSDLENLKIEEIAVG